MIDIIITRQADLIAALDAFDADAVVAASLALADALAALPGDDRPADPDQLAYGMKQAEAARIRVKYLTAWNRQKIDRLAEIRGQASPNTYHITPR
jgi:MoxR-like ATPase